MTLQKSTDINKLLVTDQQSIVWDQSSASFKYHAVYMYLLLLRYAEKCTDCTKTGEKHLKATLIARSIARK